jgi:transketolase
MNIPSLFIWTHDSVGLGEDGPTHQPIEHLMALRGLPNFTLIRPADANETVQAWKYAMTAKNPTGLVLSRQKLPILDQHQFTSATQLEKGAYILSDAMSAPEIILIATGSEVHLALEAQRVLEVRGVMTRVVSMPSFELFERQTEFYRQLVLPDEVTCRLSIELGASLGWQKWVGTRGGSIAIDRFGASAPYEEILTRFGFSVENIVEIALGLLHDPHKTQSLLREGLAAITHGHIATPPAKGSEGHS